MSGSLSRWGSRKGLHAFFYFKLRAVKEKFPPVAASAQPIQGPLSALACPDEEYLVRHLTLESLISDDSSEAITLASPGLCRLTSMSMIDGSWIFSER